MYKLRISPFFTLFLTNTLVRCTVPSLLRRDSRQKASVLVSGLRALLTVKMNRMFGTAKPKAPKATLADASATMEKRGESLDGKIMKLDKELSRYVDQMKNMKPGPAKVQVQKRAMTIMKQKKLYEGQKEKTQAQQFNVDQIQFAQESIKDTHTTVAAMKDANKVLKKDLKKVNIGKVEDMQDDMEDLLEQAEEVQAALGRSYNCDDVDEADLEAELAAMEDDPSLFFSSATEGEGAADYLDLPASGTSAVDTTAEAVPEGLPAPEAAS